MATGPKIGGYAINETRLERRPTKKPQACGNCHLRKVRCNAWQVGIPCTRCRRRNEADTCVLVGTPRRQMLGRNNVQFRRGTLASAATHCTQTLTTTPPTCEHGSEADQMSIADNQFLREGSGNATSQDIELHPESERPRGNRRQQPSPGDGLPNALDDNEAVREEDINIQICGHMAQGRPVVMSDDSPTPAAEQREIIEYHGGINSITILGETLGQKRHNRLVKAVALEERSNDNNRSPSYELDAVDQEYLSKKGALTFPSPQHCDDMLRIYFKTVYPYAPVLDRVRFVDAYSRGQHSHFLMQCILANVVPHVSKDLLKACKYESRIAAQKAFFEKAVLLYDTGYERSQLRRLQGSIMLSSLSFSYAPDKDYRFWLSNASRIAIQMGLNRDSVSASLDPEYRKLFRRLWWVLYNRDTLMAISGIDNLRRFDDRYCDTGILLPTDMDDSFDLSDRHHHLLSPLTRLQRLFMVEYTKLSIISGQFMQTFEAPGGPPSEDEVRNLKEQIATWRRELPSDLQPQIFQEWSEDNIWTLVLLAMAFRLEAVYCRCAKEYYRVRADVEAMQQTFQRQERAIFELSKVIETASMNGLVHLCPLSFMTCASTNIAMRIEIALNRSTTLRKQLAIRSQIFTDLEYLRESSEFWNSLTWTVRMFEVVIAQTQLGMEPVSRNNDKDKSSSRDENAQSLHRVDSNRTIVQGRGPNHCSVPEPGSNDVPSDSLDKSRSMNDTDESTIFQAENTTTAGDQRTDLYELFGPNPIASLPLLGDDVLGVLPAIGGYDWLQDSYDFVGTRPNNEEFLEPLRGAGLL